jgi:hypothetical protein
MDAFVECGLKQIVGNLALDRPTIRFSMTIEDRGPNWLRLGLEAGYGKLDLLAVEAGNMKNTGATGNWLCRCKYIQDVDAVIIAYGFAAIPGDTADCKGEKDKREYRRICSGYDVRQARNDDRFVFREVEERLSSDSFFRYWKIK